MKDKMTTEQILFEVSDKKVMRTSIAMQYIKLLTERVCELERWVIEVDGDVQELAPMVKQHEKWLEQPMNDEK
jgi:hypothetical protein